MSACAVVVENVVGMAFNRKVSECDISMDIHAILRPSSGSMIRIYEEPARVPSSRLACKDCNLAMLCSTEEYIVRFPLEFTAGSDGDSYGVGALGICSID